MCDELGLFELGEMAGDGGAADGKFGGQFTYTARSIGKGEDQLPPLGIAEGLEGKIREWGGPSA